MIDQKTQRCSMYVLASGLAEAMKTALTPQERAAAEEARPHTESLIAEHTVQFMRQQPRFTHHYAAVQVYLRMFLELVEFTEKQAVSTNEELAKLFNGPVGHA